MSFALAQVNVTVVIPVKNGALTLEKCLSSIRNQTLGNIEIIVLDSMSRDSSREIALKYGVTIVEIPEGTFNHGLSRNLGLVEASGDYLFYTVQDAWLSEKDTMERMIKHFHNEEVMGVTGTQAVPHDRDKNPMLWQKRFSEPVAKLIKLPADKKMDDLTHAEQHALIGWDNVVAAYRRTALLALPFANVEFAEDWIWSREALKKGWSLVYDPSIVVYHYHHSSYRYAYQLAYAINYHEFKFFNFFSGIPALLMPIARVFYHIGRHKELNIKEKIKWIVNNCASLFGKFNAHVNFALHQKMGGIKSIEKRYKKVCRIIPQGVQNKQGK